MGRRSEGPVLALLLVGFLAAVGALIVGAAIAPRPVNGLCLLALGVGAVAANRELAEVLTALNWPRSPTLSRIGVIVGGLIVAGAGVVELID